MYYSLDGWQRLVHYCAGWFLSMAESLLVVLLGSAGSRYQRIAAAPPIHQAAFSSFAVAAMLKLRQYLLILMAGYYGCDSFNVCDGLQLLLNVM
jgi:hypothetical protein